MTPEKFFQTSEAHVLKAREKAKKYITEIERYRSHLNRSSSPRDRYRGGTVLIPLMDELQKCRRALLVKHGVDFPKDARGMRKAAVSLLRSLEAKTSPKQITAAQAKVSTLRAKLLENSKNPHVRAKIVGENPAILSAADQREVLVNSWAAIKDPKAKTAFFREHQTALRSWLREMAEKGLTLGQ
jgi:hypothetical protein